MKAITILSSSMLLLCLILCGCAAYEKSYKTKGENLSMKVKEDKTLLANTLTSQETPSRGLGVDVVGQALTVAFAGVSSLLSEDTKSYNAEYHSSSNDMFFYKNPTTKGCYDPNGMQFNGFDFLRTFDNDGKTDTAIYMSFSIDKSNQFQYNIVNNSFFRLKLDKLVLNYAKAKIDKPCWYFPWSYLFVKARNKKINMDVNITITGTWINEYMQIFKDQTLGKFNLSLRKMPMDKADPKYKVYYDSLKGASLNGICFLPPRSYGHYYDAGGELQDCWGQGLYSISTSVTESGKQNLDALKASIWALDTLQNFIPVSK